TVLDDPQRRLAGTFARRDDAHRLVRDRLLAVHRGDDAALGLRDDLARHDDDVTVRERLPRQQVAHERREVVARPDLAEALGRPHREPRGPAGARAVVGPAGCGVVLAHRASFGSTSRPKTSIHSRWLRPTLWR